MQMKIQKTERRKDPGRIRQTRVKSENSRLPKPEMMPVAKPLRLLPMPGQV